MIKETLSGEAYTRRVKEIEASGGWIFRMDVGRTNGEWIIHYLYPKEDEVQAPKIAQQQEMKLNPSG